VTRALLTASLFFALAATVGAQGSGDVYSHKDGKFSVRFPGKPRETLQMTETPLGKLEVFTATYATSDGNVYMVSYTNFPLEAVTQDGRDALYDGVRDELKGKDGKVRPDGDKAREIGAKKLPGRELEIERDRGKQRLRFRIVFHDGRLYQVAVIGTTKFVEGKDATRFLDSFDVTK
jgi:hypothetical protein